MTNSEHFSYYINHYTKTTSWEDPRVRYLQIGKATSKENKNDNSSSSTMAPPPDHVSTSASESVPLKVRKVKQIPRYTYLDKQSLAMLLENFISSV